MFGYCDDTVEVNRYVCSYESKNKIRGPFACEEYVLSNVRTDFNGLDVEGYLNMSVISILVVTKLETFLTIG
jgi:hypothetical protein